MIESVMIHFIENRRPGTSECRAIESAIDAMSRRFTSKVRRAQFKNQCRKLVAGEI